MAEPVSLAIVKTHLRLDPSETDEDDFLSGMITAARRASEKAINLSVMGVATTLTLDHFPGHHHHLLPTYPVETRKADALIIELPGGTVSSVESIAYRDPTGTEQTLDPSTYIVDATRVPARVGPAIDWPRAGIEPGPIVISYTVSPLGTDDTAVVVQAMLLMMGHWYKNREATQVDARGAPAEIPLSSTWLLNSIRKWATE
jgi:uncharacterized phiE125 gp8 family phage protein